MTLVALAGLAFIIFYVFVLMNFRVPYLISQRFLSKVGFSVFFKDGSDMSVAFKVALIIASIAGVIVAVGGFFSGQLWLIPVGVIGGGIAMLLLRLVIALLGYIIWLIFSQVMIIAAMIAMFVLMIINATKISGGGAKFGASCFIIFIMALSVVLCIIGFGFAGGDTMEDILVKIIRLFV